MKRRVLFVCIHNSARSQMAEAFLKQLCPEEFERREPVVRYAINAKIE